MVKNRFGYGVATAFLDKGHIQDAITEAEREGYRYVIVVGRDNMNKKTCRFNVLGKKRREQGVSDIAYNDVIATIAKNENVSVPQFNSNSNNQFQSQQFHNFNQFSSQPSLVSQQNNLLNNPLVVNLLNYLISNPSLLISLLSSYTGSNFNALNPLNNSTNPNPLFQNLSSLPNLQNLQNPSSIPNLPNLSNTPLQNPQGITPQNLQSLFPNSFVQDSTNNNPLNNKQNEEFLRNQLQKMYNINPNNPSNNNNLNPTNNLSMQNQNDPNYLYQSQQQQSFNPSQIQSLLSSYQQQQQDGNNQNNYLISQSQNNLPNDNNNNNY